MCQELRCPIPVGEVPTKDHQMLNMLVRNSPRSLKTADVSQHCKVGLESPQGITQNKKEIPNSVTHPKVPKPARCRVWEQPNAEHQQLGLVPVFSQTGSSGAGSVLCY